MYMTEELPTLFLRVPEYASALISVPEDRSLLVSLLIENSSPSLVGACARVT